MEGKIISEVEPIMAEYDENGTGMLEYSRNQDLLNVKQELEGKIAKPHRGLDAKLDAIFSMMQKFNVIVDNTQVNLGLIEDRLKTVEGRLNMVEDKLELNGP